MKSYATELLMIQAYLVCIVKIRMRESEVNDSIPQESPNLLQTYTTTITQIFEFRAVQIL